MPTSGLLVGRILWELALALRNVSAFLSIELFPIILMIASFGLRDVLFDLLANFDISELVRYDSGDEFFKSRALRLLLVQPNSLLEICFKLIGMGL